MSVPVTSRETRKDSLPLQRPAIRCGVSPNLVRTQHNCKSSFEVSYELTCMTCWNTVKTPAHPTFTRCPHCGEHPRRLSVQTIRREFRDGREYDLEIIKEQTQWSWILKEQR
jgi:DNA-directed RNA polymerase subunit RPC12/RpoP